jgi:hypothetical protein
VALACSSESEYSVMVLLLALLSSSLCSPLKEGCSKGGGKTEKVDDVDDFEAWDAAADDPNADGALLVPIADDAYTDAVVDVNRRPADADAAESESEFESESESEEAEAEVEGGGEGGRDG